MPEIDQEVLRRNLCFKGQLIASGPHELYIAFEGKVYIDSSESDLKEAGDYFNFIAEVRGGKRPGVLEANNLTRKCYDLMMKHNELAKQYEIEGDVKGCRHLRGIGNMLAMLLLGQEASVVLPW